jgi:hypothetical protein
MEIGNWNLKEYAIPLKLFNTFDFVFIIKRVNEIVVDITTHAKVEYTFHC